MNWSPFFMCSVLIQGGFLTELSKPNESGKDVKSNSTNSDEDSEEKILPWFGSIEKKTNNLSQTCGAAFLSKHAFITSAHCVANLDNRTSIETRFSSDPSSQGDKFHIQKCSIHPKYKNSSNDFDIAICSDAKRSNDVAQDPEQFKQILSSDALDNSSPMLEKMRRSDGRIGEAYGFGLSQMHNLYRLMEYIWTEKNTAWTEIRDKYEHIIENLKRKNENLKRQNRKCKWTTDSLKDSLVSSIEKFEKFKRRIEIWKSNVRRDYEKYKKEWARELAKIPDILVTSCLNRSPEKENTPSITESQRQTVEVIKQMLKDLYGI